MNTINDVCGTPITSCSPRRHWPRRPDWPGKTPARVLALVALGFGLATARPVSAASFQSTGSMTIPRELHTATLLPNGKVLVAGGRGFNSGSHGLSQDRNELYDPATGQWTFTGKMETARQSHTATLLRNGQVLVASGEQIGLGVLASAELYDPVSGTWTATGSLHTARRFHTATLLPNGQVLIAGGDNSGFSLASAELYDPATGLWTATGSLNTPRESHTATLQPNGKVLVAGGKGPLDSVELYDPASGTWTPTGSLNSARYSHTATLLPNGQTLVAAGAGIPVLIGPGGTGSDTFVDAELYDPATGQWTPTGPMNRGHLGHTATLLPNGQVLVTGDISNIILGTNTVSELFDPATETWTPASLLNSERANHTATLLPNGQVLVVGGLVQWTAQAQIYASSAELYDWASGTWATTGSMDASSKLHTATLLPNRTVLVAGGLGLNSTGRSLAELYDLTSGTWTATGSMNTGRYDHTTTLLTNGMVLAAGGRTLGTAAGADLASAELYHPSNGTWSVTGPMNVARDSHTATVLTNGNVLVAGGHTGSIRTGADLASAELFDPVTGKWTLTGAMSTPRDAHSATLLPNGKVLVAGGFASSLLNSTVYSSAELYDPATGIWTPTGAMNTARYSHTATLLPDGKLLVAGGYNDSGTVVEADLYDPVSGTWSTTGSLAFARHRHRATLLPAGQVLVTGGANGTDDLASAELYDPAAGMWTVTGSMNTPRADHTATFLPNGTVLVAGGADNGNNLSSAELYDVGLSFQASWQPQIVAATSPLHRGSNLALTGIGFRGVAEGSGGNDSQDSPADFPVVQLLSLVNEQTLFLQCASWSPTSFISRPVDGLPIGYVLVTVFVNGIPSAQTIGRIAPPASGLWAGATDLGGGWLQFGWFGDFATNSTPWIYHAQHGWLYPVGTTTSNLWFWDNSRQTWWWTSSNPGLYPFLYRPNGVNSTWLWYYKGTTNPRWFYNFKTGADEPWP